MKHKHHDLIVKWAANKDIKFECRAHPNMNWIATTNNPSWSEEIEYREVDPYKELKEAYENDKIIQIKIHGSWQDLLVKPTWPYSPASYRIKPEPEYIPLDYSDGINLVGKVILNKGKHPILIVGVLSECVVFICGNRIKYQNLLENYTFPDGSKCGKLKA